ncbi:hypothetical protein EZS27_024337 [termite gut metagenome]|uniref:PD-(D/E)XK nuclease superfamily protein n=1 Tax=termite gut metagenome TaxID=433724 RepID=A0A5J4R1L8_9ZZZZ
MGENTEKNNDNTINNMKNLDEEVLEWHKKVLEDKRKHKENGHNFNIFELFENELNIGIQEGHHSKLIKYLLDANASHGQGNQFLMKFLESIGIKADKSDTWSVKTEYKDADIVLKRVHLESIIIIENKSNGAPDQPNQLYGYWYHIIYNKTKEHDPNFYEQHKDRYRIIYLVPNSDKKYENDAIVKPKNCDKDLPDIIPMSIETLTYDDFIQKWLSACIKILPKTNCRVRDYLIQYKTFCNQFYKKMNNALLQQTIDSFGTLKKWSALVELINNNNEIQERWWKKLQQEVSQREIKELDANWTFKLFNPCYIQWYIKGEKDNTLIIYWGRDVLKVNILGALDAAKVNKLIKEKGSQFDIIKQSFNKIDGWDARTIAQENGDFNFDFIHDGKFTNIGILAWYAGNKTEKLASQLINKVRKLQTTEITKLFKEINAECTKK